MLPKPQICVVVGRQRSGTTALAETIARGVGCRSYGEVFHHMQNPGDDGAARRFRLVEGANFFDFKMELLATRPKLAYPSAANQDSIFSDYLEFLKNDQRNNNWIILDIKYNSWLHFEEIYSTIGGVPRLFDLLAEHGAAFIHLVRRNTFSRYCSEQLALQRGKWHAEPGEEVGEATMEVDPADAMRDMKETRRQSAFFSRMLFRARRRLYLEYEDAFVENSLSKAAEQAIGDLMQTAWPPDVSIPLRKVSPSLSHVVSNRIEVLSYFRETSFQQDVETALSGP